MSDRSRRRLIVVQEDPYESLAYSIINYAVWDAKRGDLDAIAFLISNWCGEMMDYLGLSQERIIKGLELSEDQIQMAETKNGNLVRFENEPPKVQRLVKRAQQLGAVVYRNPDLGDGHPDFTFGFPGVSVVTTASPDYIKRALNSHGIIAEVHDGVNLLVEPKSSGQGVLPEQKNQWLRYWQGHSLVLWNLNHVNELVPEGWRK